MGVINVTPDSFSDGGIYLDSKVALEKAISFKREGVDVIDIGAQSTRPGAIRITSENELERILPVLRAIRNELPELIISIDTFDSQVAKECLQEGANWINDISGGRLDKNMSNIITNYNCPFVITHSRGTSQNMNKLALYKDVVNEVYAELLLLTNDALESGVSPDRIIWDPGIGFAKTTDHNIKLIRALRTFSKSNFPILVGPSRKRFIGDITNEVNPINRIWGTAAVVCKCVEQKVDLVRVHDVYAMRKLLLMAEEIW